MDEEPKPRRCTHSDCKQPNKTEKDFNRSRKGPGGLSYWCRECSKREHKKWYGGNVEYMRQKNRMNKFGITHEEYSRMLGEQRNVCLICGKPETATYNGRVLPLSVDHDHETGRVRGLLCKACNSAVGYLSEDPRRARRVGAYIQAYNSGHPDPHRLLVELRRIGAF